MFTGGLGTLLFIVFYGELYRPFDCNVEWEFDFFCICRLYAIMFCNKNCQTVIFVLIILISGFIGYFGTLYCIFFSDIASKACKITYPIFYGVFSIIFGLFPWISSMEKNNTTACPIKKKTNNKYHLIKIDGVEIYK